MSERAYNENFGQRVRVALAASGVTRSALAAACEISPQAVKRWCEGSAMPSSKNLMTFSRLTGASLEWLMWPHPVDIQSTDWAVHGRHIKHIVQRTIDELHSEGVFQ